jgi:hypothetical protein
MTETLTQMTDLDRYLSGDRDQAYQHYVAVRLAPDIVALRMIRSEIGETIRLLSLLQDHPRPR